MPAAVTAYLAFNAGGYFALATGVAAVGLLALIAVRVMLAEDPTEGLGPAAVVAASALGVLAVLQLVSTAWSDAPARALLEFDRTLLYLAGFLLAASAARDREALRWAVRLMGLSLAGIAIAGLLTRTLPDVFPIPPNVLDERLSYPITYWNGLGLITAVGIILSLHLTSDADEPRAVRVLAAAALPALAATLLLTFSRGPIALGVVGLVGYAVVARPRLLPTALLAVSPPAAVAVAVTYGADRLSSPEPTTSAAAAQGHDVAIAIAVSCLAAAIVRAVVVGLDGRLADLRIGRGARRAAMTAMAAAAAAAVLIGVVVLDAPERLENQYASFVEDDALLDTGDVRDRLTAVGNNGRLDHWRVALDGFAEAPIRGLGAGTYETLWARDRDSSFTVRDGHSLYLESLAELGVAGTLPLIVALLAILVGVAARIREGPRPLYAAVLVGMLLWATHAGIDWDWELPATGFFVFALGGLALAQPRATSRLRVPGRGLRLGIALSLLAVAVTPALVALSQARLERAVESFRGGDCPAAVDAALSSTDALRVRPEPFALLGYCDVRLGQPNLAVRMMQNAVRLDPSNWEYRYGLALVRASAGLDPRQAAAEALRLNPLEPMARDAVDAFNDGGPQVWRRRALDARLPIR